MLQKLAGRCDAVPQSLDLFFREKIPAPRDFSLPPVFELSGYGSSVG
jgi:hypothetical protein